VTYEDSPSNGAQVIDSQDQQFDASLDEAGCPSFAGGSVRLPPGDERLGCIVFYIPKSAEIKRFQFTLNCGFGTETGQCRL